MTSIIDKIRACENALTVTKLAKMMSMSRQAVYNHIESGQLKAIKFGQTIRLDPKVVIEYLERFS